jgi:hypothetical protein
MNGGDTRAARPGYARGNGSDLLFSLRRRSRRARRRHVSAGEWGRSRAADVAACRTRTARPRESVSPHHQRPGRRRPPEREARLLWRGDDSRSCARTPPGPSWAALEPSLTISLSISFNVVISTPPLLRTSRGDRRGWSTCVLARDHLKYPPVDTTWHGRTLPVCVHGRLARHHLLRVMRILPESTSAILASGTTHDECSARRRWPDGLAPPAAAAVRRRPGPGSP